MGLTSFLNPIYILSVLIALTVHECAHAFVARKLGDPTAEHEGRLTLNPLAHLDPLGTLMFLLVGFGWAKPVPVNPRYFRHPKRDVALVSLAGPASNLVLAFLAAVLLAFLSPDVESMGVGTLLAGSGAGSVFQALVTQLLLRSLFVNLALMAFNLLPVAPLDGSKILQAFIPWKYEDAYEEFMRMGPYLLLGLIIAENFLPISILSTWVFGITEWVLGIFVFVLG